MALNGTVVAQGGQKRGPDTPSNPRRLTTDPCNKVAGNDNPAGAAALQPADRAVDFGQVIEERAVIDALSRPAHLGGIDQIARALQVARKAVDEPCSASRSCRALGRCRWSEPRPARQVPVMLRASAIRPISASCRPPCGDFVQDRSIPGRLLLRHEPPAMRQERRMRRSEATRQRMKTTVRASMKMRVLGHLGGPRRSRYDTQLALLSSGPIQYGIGIISSATWVSPSRRGGRGRCRDTLGPSGSP